MHSASIVRQISDCSKYLLEMNRKFFCADTHLLSIVHRAHLFTCSEQFNSIYYGTDNLSIR